MPAAPRPVEPDAAEFDPRSLPVGSRVSITLNGGTAEFTTPVKSGDKVDVTISQH